MNRRQFLVTLPAAMSMSRPGSADPGPASFWKGWRSGGSLIVVELLGGCDGYSLAVPWRDEWYYRRRPGIAIERKDLLPLDDATGFPSAMAELHDLFGRGMVAVLDGIGWGGAPISHFEARARFSRSLQALGAGQSEATTCRSAEELSQHLRRVAGVAGREPNRLYRLGLSGFDTHAGQGAAGGPLNRLLGKVAESVAGLSRRLVREGVYRDVAILVATEFGRGIDENRFGGTDHGTAAPWLLIGERVTPGLFGRRPHQLHESDSAAAALLPIHPDRLLAGLAGVAA